MNDIFAVDQPQVMIDLETLSVAPNGVIVALAATKFTLEKGVYDTFEINIDPTDSRQYGLHIDKETIAWWRKQPKEISDLWRVDPKPLKEALQAFNAWFGPRTLPVYGNSPSFDCVMVKESMKAVGLACPWVFRDEVDYRTICKMVNIPYTKGDKLHSALNDAITQTEHLMKILRS